MDRQIETSRDSTDCGNSYSIRYGPENRILKRLQIMRELGASAEEIRQYREKNRRFTAVRMLETEECIQYGKYKDAIRVLKESKELDQSSRAWVREHSRKLIELYGRLHMDKEYKEELMFQVFSCRQEPGLHQQIKGCLRTKRVGTEPGETAVRPNPPGD